MQCILCEKPSAAKNYAAALGGMNGTFNGKKYQIVNSVGHIYQTPSVEELVDKDKIDFYKKWDLGNLPWKFSEIKFHKKLNPVFKETFEKIKAVAEKCDEFVIATDDDPTGEGTLLAIEIIDGLKLKGVKYYRSFHIDESPKEIQKAMMNLTDLGANPKTDPDFKKAWYRDKWDYMSIQWTRIFSCLNGDGDLLRQGRLKSYMVFAVGEQIKKVKEYKKVPYYQRRFIDENGNYYSCKDEPMYERKEEVPIGELTESAVILDSEETKYSAPPALYDLNMLSATLAPKGFDSKTVLSVYQKMYENHLVSYPRTEDKTITPEQFKEFEINADAIARVVGVDPKLLVRRSPRKTHVKSSGSHGANRPGSTIPKSLADLEKEYGKCGSVIYQFLARNSLAMLCEDYEYIHQTGHIEKYPEYKGSVNIPSKPGYKVIFNVEKDSEPDKEYKKLGKEGKPTLYEGFPPKPKWPTAKWLAQLLKNNDVGTGATRTSIYAAVTDQKSKCPLLLDEKGKITMTRYGEKSYILLQNTHIGDVKLTENLQAQMKAVAEGANPIAYLNDIEKLILEDIETVSKNSEKYFPAITIEIDEDALFPTLKTDSLKCPKCGKPLRTSDKSCYCTGYKEGCDFGVFKQISGKKLTDNQIYKLIHDGKTAKISGFKSKSGKKFDACLVLDENKKVKFDFSKR